MLRWLARRLGIVRASSLAALTKQLRKVEAKLAAQAEAIEQARGEVKTWKSRAVEAEKIARDADTRMAQQRQQWEDAKGDAEKQIRELRAELEAQAQQRADLKALRKRLSDAERELTVAREYLMLFEVKLDVLEGAANVLDSRTRALTRRRDAIESDAAIALDTLERRLG
jgi:chromosome segregation ATPase